MHFQQLENILENDGIVFLSYGGFLTQALISSMTDALEKEAKHNELSMEVSHNIFTIFIELSQNMMNYAKFHQIEAIKSSYKKGLIIVGLSPDEISYYILSRNIINAQDKETIESRLKEIEGLDKDSLRALYREKRKIGHQKHEYGAGIGFIEIARRCDKLEYHFHSINENLYYFTVKATIHK